MKGEDLPPKDEPHRLRHRQLQTIIQRQRIGVLDVQHAAPAIGLRFGRRVDDERPHRDDAAGGADALHRLNVASESRDFIVRHHAARVRSGKNAERAVVRG